MESLGYAAHIRTPDNTLARVSAVRDDCRNYIFLPTSLNLAQPLERRDPNPYVGELIQK